MKRLILTAAVPAMAHMVSISTGEIRINGSKGMYQMRMPIYEVAHLKQPERDLPSSITFSSNGAPGRVVSTRCRNEANESALICEVELAFSGDVEILDAKSALHRVTVPNHAHVLRAVRGEATDQGVLDLSFPEAKLRFRPPTTFELASQQGLSGALRAAGAAQMLFLVSLVVAARSRKELVLMGAAFLAGELAAAAGAPAFSLQPAPGFVEAACALTIAYLAVETLFLPEAGKRWLVVCVLGLLHGLYFALFLTETAYGLGYVMSGALLTEAALLAAMAYLFDRVRTPLARLQPVRALSAILLVVGMGWFFYRMKG